MGNETGGHAEDRQHPRAPTAEGERPWAQRIAYYKFEVTSMEESR